MQAILYVIVWPYRSSIMGGGLFCINTGNLKKGLPILSSNNAN
jgi:hypothetical protein